MTMDPNRTQIPRTRPKPGDCTSPGGGGGSKTKHTRTSFRSGFIKKCDSVGGGSPSARARAHVRKQRKGHFEPFLLWTPLIAILFEGGHPNPPKEPPLAHSDPPFRGPPKPGLSFSPPPRPSIFLTPPFYTSLSLGLVWVYTRVRMLCVRIKVCN